MLTFNFESARKDLFKNGYTQLQVDSINAIMAEANKSDLNIFETAYVLATAYHEAFDYDGKTTGKIQRLVPIKEKGSLAYLKSKKYYPYIGYGFVQLTWLDNYRKYQPLILDKFKVDILKNYELLLRTDIAAFVIVHGMKNGTYTGKKLKDYADNASGLRAKDARRIVNGTDKAAEIESYYFKFMSHLKG